MTSFFDRLRSKSLQASDILPGFFKGREGGGAGMGFLATVQQTVFDARSTVQEKVNEMTSADGPVQAGAGVSNIVPNLRGIRVVPAPVTAPAGMQAKWGSYPPGFRGTGLQQPIEDIEALERRGRPMQTRLKDVELLDMFSKPMIV